MIRQGWTNPLDEYKDEDEKIYAWATAVFKDELAIDYLGKKYPVKDFGVKKLAFVGGLWRVQREFPYKTTKVRDQDMVLLEKINHFEKTLFEYYYAKAIWLNCYGRFISQDNHHDYIVAKYETDNQTYWGYGKTLEDARAYLGLKIYDEYKEIINKIACKDRLKTNNGK